MANLQRQTRRRLDEWVRHVTHALGDARAPELRQRLVDERLGLDLARSAIDRMPQPDLEKLYRRLARDPEAWLAKCLNAATLRRGEVQ